MPLNTMKNDDFESPWGRRPSNQSNSETELDRALHMGKKKLQEMFPDGKNYGKTIVLFVAAIILLWSSSGFYNVSQEERAIVMRFGKFVRVATPGLNYKIPNPIEQVIVHKVDRVEEEQIGFRSNKPSGGNFGNGQKQAVMRNVLEESLMLTGDENIVDVHYTVQWNIKDIKDYVFSLQLPKETVRSVAESAMREVVGNSPIMSIFEERSIIEQAAKNLIQKILDSYHAGIVVTNFSIQDADPPSEVADAFRDVQTALADKEREINQAQAYQNDIIPRARGEAARIIQEAEGYQQEVMSMASGEVSRYNAIYAQYKNSKRVTKERLYLEAITNVLQGTDVIILDKSLERSVLPYLPLNSVNK